MSSYIRSIQKLLLEENEKYDIDHHETLAYKLQSSSNIYNNMFHIITHNNNTNAAPHLKQAQNHLLDDVARDHQNLINYETSHNVDSGVPRKFLDHVEESRFSRDGVTEPFYNFKYKYKRS